MSSTAAYRKLATKVNQSINFQSIKYVFKTIFSLFLLLGGWRGNERSCSSASREIFPTFFGMLVAPTCCTPSTPSTVQHHFCGAIASIGLNQLLSNLDSVLISRSSFHRYRWMFTVISPTRSGLVANQLATKKSHRLQVMSLH